MSNPRIVQNNGQRIYLKQVYGAGNFNTLSTTGISGPATLVGGNLNIPNYTSGSAMPTSMPLASQVGILANGTDQTANLNTIFSNSLYAGIVMDYSSPAAVTISGTVNCQGKRIFFQPGSYFTGSGTLNNVEVDGWYRQKFFDTTISLTNATSGSSMFSVMWYGAGFGGDDAAACQKASDTIIANGGMVRDIYMPVASYSFARPWMLYNWSGTNYTQFTVNIIGGKMAANSSLSGYPQITPSFKDGPVIGVQRATSGSISGLAFIGPLNYSASFSTFVSTSFATANAAGPNMRNSEYSPFCAICIDPVRQDGAFPPDGGYPELNGSEPGGLNWYRGTGTTGGTTDFRISQCYISGFTVDIMNSPNGQTQQGEDCVIEDCALHQCNVAVAYGTTQSDNNLIRRCRSWYFVWTVVDNQQYGNENGYVANIDGYNVAGFVNSLFNFKTNKPVSIRNFYAESFFSMGLAQSTYGVVSIEGNFDFYLPVTVTPQYHFRFLNVVVQNSRMRYYDDLFTKRLHGTAVNCTFDNVYFDLPPYIINQYTSQLNVARFTSCNTNAGVLGMENDVWYYRASQVVPVCYGKFKVQDGSGLDYAGSPTITLDYSCDDFNRVVSLYASGVSITVSGTNTASFTVSSTNALLCYTNDIVIDHATGNVMGRISNISGTTITISEIPINITNGTYTLDLIYFLLAYNNCVGDVVSGSASINNVTPFATGSYAICSFLAGSRFDNPNFPLGAYIVSYNSSTGVITMSVNATATATRQNFTNGDPVCEVKATYSPGSTSANSQPYGFPSGTIWTELTNAAETSGSTSTNNKWVFNLGGYCSATTLGFGSAYQGDYNIEYWWRVHGGSFQYFDNTGGGWTNA